MNAHTLRLDLTPLEQEQLTAHYQEVVQHLEQGEGLSTAILEKLGTALTQVVSQSPQWQEILQQVHRDGGDYHSLRLVHEDNLLLNLPWSMAEDALSGLPLGRIHNLYLAKSVASYYKETEAEPTGSPAPLKILVMVSSPEDPEGIKQEGWKHRLSYEAEELAILHAFEPLMQADWVQIDFTPNGSLAALKEKLLENHYHILHYTGHATYEPQTSQGYLLLEEEMTLASHWVTDQEFAAVVHGDPDYCVPLVVLASCQTAQGRVDRGLSGVTNQLLRVGVPVVVSMGVSITDAYATIFAGRFYGGLARKETVFAAFQQAITQLREQEQADLVARHVKNPVPLQWLIPNLYVSRPRVKLVAWDKAAQPVQLKSSRYLFNRDKLLLDHQSAYYFIGRRREKAAVLAPFLKKTPVLLKGQGGVGKTALAEHLVQRLIALNPKTQPFVLDETHKSLDSLLKAMQKFLRANGGVQALTQLHLYPRAIDQFAFLAFEVKKTHQPVFVLDNLETFQENPGANFAPEYADLWEVLSFLCDDAAGQFHLLLTCRYPLAGLGGVVELDLNQVGFTDFLRKCYALKLNAIAHLLQEKANSPAARVKGHGVPTFMEVVSRLYAIFGGNYRALEFFTGLVVAEPEQIQGALDSLEDFVRDTADKAALVTQQMGENLLFAHLLALLTPSQQHLLRVLSFFRIPVTERALAKQEPASPHGEELLAVLHRYTLLEISLDRQSQTRYYYVTPLVKDLLSGTAAEPVVTFDHQAAGDYYYHVVENEDGDLTEYKEAFYHYDLAGTTERLAEIGEWLSRIYYGYSLFHNAYYYALRVYECLGEETEPEVLNTLGVIYDMFGQYEGALSCYLRALAGYKKIGDKKGEGTTLNNISQIYYARGDYAGALSYLEQSLGIRREIGDKSGEGTTLNNISGIYLARGDYAGALSYLEQSLAIVREIGDKSGEGTTLHNMAIIADENKEPDKYLAYETEAYQIATEINDAMGMYHIGRDLGYTLAQAGEKEHGLAMLYRSLKIGQKAGFPDVGEVEELIQLIEGGEDSKK